MKRLSAEDAEHIRSLYRLSSCSMERIARHFKISATTVAKIIDGKWKPFVPKRAKK